MKNKQSTIKYEDLNDTITPLDYAAWRGIGENKAREIFNSKGFPLIQGMGTKLIADKRAVFIYELGLSNQDKEQLLKELAVSII
jgi:hypothetical protein